MDEIGPALRRTPEGYTLNIRLGDLHVFTPDPVSEEMAREYLRRVWAAFLPELVGYEFERWTL